MISRTASIVIAATALALTLHAAPAGAARNLASVLAEIDGGFTCPEFLPDDDARRADLLAFSRALASVGPKRLTYRQAAYIRAKILVRHHCTIDSGAVASAVPTTKVVAAAN